jgi:hypothetical protein
VLAAMLLTASVASASFLDGEYASATLSTDTLQPPTNLAAGHGPCTAGLVASITLTWTATPSTWADGYEVLGSLLPTGPFAVVGTVAGASSTSHTVTGLAFGTTYHYVVKATKGNWRSPATAVASRTTLSALCL